mmetsp:Transcript_9721/g.19663  ORF Transcript_9721/g.19663 Transcript_9721/m.19663 type:complete len:215 (+) Transcript_9721:210-854(+)
MRYALRCQSRLAWRHTAVKRGTLAKVKLGLVLACMVPSAGVTSQGGKHGGGSCMGSISQFSLADDASVAAEARIRSVVEELRGLRGLQRGVHVEFEQLHARDIDLRHALGLRQFARHEEDVVGVHQRHGHIVKLGCRNCEGTRRGAIEATVVGIPWNGRGVVQRWVRIGDCCSPRIVGIVLKREQPRPKTRCQNSAHHPQVGRIDVDGQIVHCI